MEISGFRDGLRRVAMGCAVAALFLVAGCGAGDEGERVPLRSDAGAEALPSDVAAWIDSGNAAYRDGRFEEARRHYREAAERLPESGTAWFGVYMAETAVGNRAAADSALGRVGELGEAARLHHVPEDGGRR